MKRKQRRNGRRGRDRHSRFSGCFFPKNSDDGTSDSPLQQRRRTQGDRGLHPIVSNRGMKMKRGVGVVKALSSMLDETRSTSRAGSSVVLPQFLGNSQSQGRSHGLHSYHQQPNSTAVRFSSMRRSAGPRGSAPIGSMHSADHPGVFLVPSGSSGQNLVDAENNEGSRFYAWERDRFAPYPLAPVDSESNWWGQFHHVAGGSDSSSRTPFWHRHGTERQSSQGRTENPYQSSHAPRLHPFI